LLHTALNILSAQFIVPRLVYGAPQGVTRSHAVNDLMSGDGFRREEAMMRTLIDLRRAVGAAVLVAAASLTLAGSASAWSTDYPLGGCFSTANGQNVCQLGYYTDVTYNSGTAPGLQAGVCVYAITQAGYIKGGGQIPCTSTSYFINECFISGGVPASNAVTYARLTDKVLVGHADNSPNHTGCI
jgi:hypothetical protein